jgi:hypothetical protein
VPEAISGTNLGDDEVRAFMRSLTGRVTVLAIWKRGPSDEEEVWLGYTEDSGGRYAKVRWTHYEADESTSPDLQHDGRSFAALRDSDGDVVEELGTLPASPAICARNPLVMLRLEVTHGVDLDAASRAAATRPAARQADVGAPTDAMPSTRVEPRPSERKGIRRTTTPFLSPPKNLTPKTKT